MKYVFITGVSSGIGLDALHTLVSQGYHVIGTVRNKSIATKLQETYGTSATFLVFDVQDIEATRSAIDTILPQLTDKGLFALINNAGIAVPGPLQYLTEEEFEQQLDVNVKSVRRITNLLLPYLGVNSSYPPGKIINISSVSGLFSSPFNGAYSISKHALESMNDVYRRELAPFNIPVVAIEPGPIKTKIWSKNLGALDRFQSTEYGKYLSSADKMIQNAEDTALDVSVISETLIDILLSTKPKHRYLIHKKKTIFYLFAKWLPSTWQDKLVMKTLLSKKSHRPV